MNVNVKDAKSDRRADCWNCGGYHFARDRTKPAKEGGDRQGKVNVSYRDNYDDDCDDGLIFICFENSHRGCLENFDDTYLMHN